MALPRLRRLHSVLQSQCSGYGREKVGTLWEHFLGGARISAASRLGRQASHSGYATSAAGTAESGSGEKLGLSALVLLLPPALTFFLGSWQLQRRQWKLDLLELRAQRLEEDPVPLGAALREASAQDDQSSSSRRSSSGSEGEAGSPLEYRRVSCEGTFDEAHTLYVGPRVRSVYGVGEKGFYVVTPLLPANPREPPVLVNRGWVPSAWRDAEEKSRPSDPHPRTAPAASPSPQAPLSLEASGRAAAAGSDVAGPGGKEGRRAWWFFGSGTKQGGGPADEETASGEEAAPAIRPLRLSGVVRSSESPSSFVPPNVPETGQWFYVDVPRMARACGLPEDTVLVDLVKGRGDREEEEEGLGLGFALGERTGEQAGGSESGGQRFPIPKDPSELVKQKVMPQDHLTYAATWYTLSAATGFLAYKRLRGTPVRRGRKGR